MTAEEFYRKERAYLNIILSNDQRDVIKLMEAYLKAEVGGISGDLTKIGMAIGLLNSMVLSGEQHSVYSKNKVEEAFDLIQQLLKQ